MKKLSLIAFFLVAVIVLTGCKKDSNDASENFYVSYAGHYETLNYLLSQSGSDQELTANFVDGLVENDNFGAIQPSLAKTWSSEITDDGKEVWTLNLREGVQWLEYNGSSLKEYGAEVTADDWVAAAEYILEPNNNSETVGLWFLFIDNAQAYYKGEVDFEDVGVKAVDDYTLQYTLSKPAPYFLSALTYNPFFPVNREYLTAQGTIFGFDGENILYNGAYYLTEDDIDAKYVMTKNPLYWDEKNVHIEKVTGIYIPGSAGTDWARMKYENGELSAFRIQEDDQTGWDKYVVGKDESGTLEDPVHPDAYTRENTSKYTYYMLWNWDRENFDGNEDKTSDQKHATEVALQNADFRLGFFYGLDRSEFLAQYTAGNPVQWARNTYNPRKLATDLNGKDYIDYLAEEYAEKEDVTFDEALAALADGTDSKFQPARALQHFVDAKAALLTAGLEEADFPIEVDSVGTINAARIPYYEAFVDAFNEAFGDYVYWNLVTPNNDDEWTLWNNKNISYDLRFYMGWGPDYADPLTYLNTYVVNGDMLAYSGIEDETEDAAIQELLLRDYTDLVEAGDAYNTLEEYPQRFEKFAEAEYNLLYEQALIIPIFSPSGTDVFVSKVKPYTAMEAPYGLSGFKYKLMVVLDTPLTRAERNELKDAYEAEKNK